MQRVYCKLLLFTSCGILALHTLVFADDLSKTRLCERDGSVWRVSGHALPYQLNTALFSDYALKYRAIHLPPNQSLRFVDDKFEFPQGTVLSKTFYYPKHRAHQTKDYHVLHTSENQRYQYHESIDLSQNVIIETRLLTLIEGKWSPSVYVWNAEQTEANADPLGNEKKVTFHRPGEQPKIFHYQIPDKNQCGHCHADRGRQNGLQPLGLKLALLNRNITTRKGNYEQTKYWIKNKALKTNKLTKLPSSQTGVRSYLDINCGHCHNPAGLANSSALYLSDDVRNRRALGICKPVVSASQPTATPYQFNILPGKPTHSYLLYRIQSLEATVKMPEIGRQLVHTEGVALIAQWIKQLDGTCP